MSGGQLTDLSDSLLTVEIQFIHLCSIVTAFTLVMSHDFSCVVLNLNSNTSIAKSLRVSLTEYEAEFQITACDFLHELNVTSI
jgi:hypothetical protein